MATYKEFKGPALEAYRSVRAMARQLAEAEIGVGNITERSLRPEDLNSSLTSFNFSVTTTSGSTNLVSSQTIANGRWVYVYGVSYPVSTPLIDQLTVTGKGKTLRVWNIEDIPHFMDNVGYVDDPVMFLPNTTVTIAGFNGTTTTSSADNLIIIGGVAERKGMVTSD